MSSQKKLAPDDELMDAERILINPLNLSRSKQQYSFPRAERWQRSKTQQDNYHFYEVPTTQSKVSATIGTGKRTNLTKNDKMPAPNQYNYTIEGQFGSTDQRSGQKSSKGFIFGLGRDEIKTNSFLRVKTEGPPPNAYHPKTAPKRNEFSFSKEKRLRESMSNSDIKLGPGSYQLMGSLREDQQILSTQQRRASPKIQEVKVENRKKSIQVAPVLYHPMTTAKGQRLDLKRCKGFRIGTSKRGGLVQGGDAPGPGRYKMFSEFISKGKY